MRLASSVEGWEDGESCGWDGAEGLAAAGSREEQLPADSCQLAVVELRSPKCSSDCHVERAAHARAEKPRHLPVAMSC